MKQKAEKPKKIKIEIEFVRRKDADKATLARIDACEEEFRKLLLDRYYDDRAKQYLKRNDATPIHA